MSSDLLQQIRQGCEQLALALTEQQQTKLLNYIRLIEKWNKTYNLTSVRSPSDMIGRHLMDSLSILPFLRGSTLLDVGTGAGLPGIPVAIARPDIAVTLLDTNSKKTRFLQQVKAELRLANVTVIHARVEESALPLFSMVTARAVAKVGTLIELAGQHCEKGGLLLFMKGVYPLDETKGLQSGFSLLDVVKLNVPGCDGQRHLVRIVKE